jgi:hypothetical protein
MGMYIYGIRSPKHNITVKLDTGATMVVAKYAYAYKPLYSFWDKEPNWQILAKARLFRMDNIWAKFVNAGGKWPQGGVMVYGEKDNSVSIGSSVMTWPQLKDYLPTSIEDCTCNKATYAGKVAEILS